MSARFDKSCCPFHQSGGSRKADCGPFDQHTEPVPVAEPTIAERIAQLAAEYDVDADGTIRTPGKFEGENVVALYLYELDGISAEDDSIWDGGEDSSPYNVYFLDAELREACPWLAANDVAFVTWESGSGFYNVETVTQAALDKLRADCAAGPDEEDITVSPAGDAYYYRKLIAPARDGARDDAGIRAWMERESYFPNVWQEDDHGGYTLIELE